MKCKNCGCEFNSKFCPDCGTPANAIEIKEELESTETHILEKTNKANVAIEDIKNSEKNPPETSAFNNFDTHKIINISNYKWLVIVIVVVILIIFFTVGICVVNSSKQSNNNATASSTLDNNDARYKEYNLNEISIKTPKKWRYIDKEDTQYFYNRSDDYSFLMVSSLDDSESPYYNKEIINTLIDSVLEAIDGVSEINRENLTIDSYPAVHVNYTHNINNMDGFSSAYFIFGYKKFYTFSFNTVGKTLDNEFKKEQDHIIDSISINNTMDTAGSKEYVDYDNYHSTDDIEYTKINTKKLYRQHENLFGEAIKTTIRITSINADGDNCAYTVYDVDDYDEVKIKLYDVKPDRELKKGDYITVSGTCYYEDNYDSLLIEINVDKVNKTNKKLFKAFGKEKKPTVYREGQYKVGTDIPSGTYIAYPTDSYGGYYCISTDTNGDDIVANENFDGQNYFTVQDGQYLNLSGCVAHPVSEKEKVTYNNGYLYEGQYLVGDDVPAGTYKIYSLDKWGGYYALTSDANGDDIHSNDNFDGERYITISYGEYLTLSNCKIKIK